MHRLKPLIYLEDNLKLLPKILRVQADYSSFSKLQQVKLFFFVKNRGLLPALSLNNYLLFKYLILITIL